MNFVSKCKHQEIMLFWSHHETQLFRRGYHPRKEEKRKTKDNMVRQRDSVDRYGLRKSSESNGQQKSVEREGRSMVWSTLGLRKTEVKSIQKSLCNGSDIVIIINSKQVCFKYLCNGSNYTNHCGEAKYMVVSDPVL